MAFRPWFLARALLLSAPLLVSGCTEDSAGFALIGPEGGEVSHDGVTLKIPAGALVATRQIVIRPIDDDLSRGVFKQKGGAYRIEPTDLDLKIPAELSFGGDAPAKPAVLWRRGEGRVVAHAAADDRAVAFIGGLGVVAAAEGDTPAAVVDDPVLARVPADVDYSKAAVNAALLKVTPSGTTALDIGLTAYDPMGTSNRPLNGDGTRYCGFKPGAVQGGSITAGCSGGRSTVSVSVNSTQVQLEALPFLLGKVDQPVLVEVQVGTGDLAHSVGYFGFTTSACYLESCSGHGMCDDSSGAAKCVCDEGYAAGAELSCDCVPQCDGKQCGGDGCGSDCGDCGPDAQCNDQGQCEGNPPPMTSSDSDSGDASSTADMTTTTGEMTTTTGDETTTTGGSSSGSSTGDGSSGSSSSSG